MASAGLVAPPLFVQLAAHPLRWRLLTELAGSDLRVRELVQLVSQPQNLVSYHLRLLRESELITARRSSFDARDTYYHLDLDRCAHALAATGRALHPGLVSAATPPGFGRHRPRVTVLFACTGNSARSPIAAALLRHRIARGVEVISAGSHPKPRPHPNAVRVLREQYGIEIAAHRPRRLDSLAGRRFDYVITLCDKVREACPDFRDDPRRMHWSIADPAGYPAFSRTAAEIDTRVRYLLPMLAPKEAQP